MFFASPHRLYWLLMLIPMVGAAVGFVYWQRSVRESIGEPDLVEAMSENRSRPLQWIRVGLVLVGTALLVLAAAEPKWGRTADSVEREGVDLVYALDLSKSMLARDVAPTRLGAATGEMKKTLARLDGDRVGLVVYTTVSYVQSPLTTDYGALEFYLDNLDPSQMSVGGTAIGAALRDSVELLTGRALGSDESQASRNARVNRAETQVIVLMSDGEDHETSPVEVAKKARERGIRIVTVGIGSEAGAKIPVVGEGGEVRGYKRSAQGDVVKTSLQEKKLRQIAKASGGTYVRYRGDGSVANELSSIVDRLEATQLEAKVTRQYRDRYLWFAIPAFLALLASFLLGERRNGRLGWSTRAGTAELFVVLAVAFGTTACDDAFREPHPAVREGNRALQNEDHAGALDAYETAEQQLDPVPPALYYNKGRAQLGDEEYEKARQAFGRALGSNDPELQFDAHVGIGVAFSREEKWPRAVESYRRALGVHGASPSAISDEALADARHNLEYAYRELYPPCDGEEDDLEENDTPEEAAELEKESREGLTLCGLDDDWFAVPAVPGARVTVEATFRTLGPRDDPDHEFLPNPEDLQLNVHGHRGEKRVAHDHGAPEDEPEEGGPVERTVDSFVVDDQTPLGRDSRLLVQLRAADKLKFAYDLTIRVEPPCRKLEESSEDNDGRDEAASLDPGRHDMQLCAGDSDWFRVDVARAHSVFVDVRPAQRKKPGKSSTSQEDRTRAEELEFEMVDAETGEPAGNARREGPFWTGGLQESRRDRALAFRVSGGDGVETPYRVRVYDFEPCMPGDDPYESNDSLEAAASLMGKSRFHRYLRICSDNEDYYSVKPKKSARGGKKPKKGGSGKSGPSPLRLGLATAPSPHDPELDFRALHPTSGEVTARGREPDAKRSTKKKPGSMAFDQVLKAERPRRDEAVPVRVAGDPSFYHLVQIPPGKGKNQNKQNKNQKKNGKKQSNKQNKPDKKRGKNQKPSKRQNQKRKKQKQARKQKQKKSEAERTQDILDALENSDKNFQMQKALEKNRQKGAVQKDW